MPLHRPRAAVSLTAGCLLAACAVSLPAQHADPAAPANRAAAPQPTSPAPPASQTSPATTDAPLPATPAAALPTEIPPSADIPPAPDPVRWDQRRSATRAEVAVGPSLLGLFPRDPPAVAGTAPAPSLGSACTVGGAVSVGFRHVSEYMAPPGASGLSLLKIPIIGWIFFPLIPLLVLGPSIPFGNQHGLDLRFAVHAPCDGASGGRALQYSLALRPVARVSPTGSRLRFPSLLGAVIPEPIFLFDGGGNFQFELGLLRFPVSVLLTPHVGLELEPTLGYRFSLSSTIPDSVTLAATLNLLVR